MKKFLLAALIIVLPSFSQTFSLPNATPLAFPVYQFVDQNGKPLAGAYLCSFAAGTSTPLATYADAGAVTANPNPKQLDASGRITVYGGPNLYKLVLYKGTQLTCPSTDPVVTQADNFGDSTAYFVNYIKGLGNTGVFTYNGPNAGTAISLNAFLNKTIDVRNFGAVGVTGNCHTSTVDNATAIQAALIYAGLYGPLDVTLPNGYCWPIASHVWIPAGVHFHGQGRNTGYETSGPGSLLIANANWSSGNGAFPFSQMVWETGQNYTSGTYYSSNRLFGQVVDHMEINCNDQVGCGNMFADGRQEQGSFHDIIATGGVPFSAGYSFGFFEQGVDCGTTAPGCLLTISGSPVFSNPFSSQQGPDYNLEIFPSYNNPKPGFIPWAGQGLANYKGLRDSTINCNGSGAPYGEYAWGSQMFFLNVHTEGCGTTSENTGLYLGNIPSVSSTGCVGADNTNVVGSDAPTTIAACNAQTNLRFINQNSFYNSDNIRIVNLTNGAHFPTVTVGDWSFDQSTHEEGPLGFGGGVYSKQQVLLTDPGTYLQAGLAGYHEYSGTLYSGLNLGIANTTQANTTRAYGCGNAYWTPDATTGWQLGGDGGTDYSCWASANGGNFFISNNAVQSTPWTSSNWFSNVHLSVSGDTGNTLISNTGYFVNTTTGQSSHQGTATLQLNGGIGGDVQWISGPGCSTSNTAGNTCSVTLTWRNAYANGNYLAICGGYGVSAGSPSPVGIANQTATQVTFTTQASQAVVSGYNQINCWAGPNVY